MDDSELLDLLVLPCDVSAGPAASAKLLDITIAWDEAHDLLAWVR
jgi:hypothetical protein